MPTFDIRVAKTRLAHLVDEAIAGNEIIITKAGKSVAKLVPLAPAPATKRRLGRLAGRATIPRRFDAALPNDILDAFEN